LDFKENSGMPEIPQSGINHYFTTKPK